MDFGDILSQWEEQKKQKEKKQKKELDDLIEVYLPAEKDLLQKEKRDKTNINTQKKIKKQFFSIDDTVDLHGMRLAEAEKYLQDFLASRYKKGSEAVLVIHGKGNHNRDGQSVLKSMTEDLCRETTYIGHFEKAPLSLGGTGATCLYFKRKN